MGDTLSVVVVGGIPMRVEERLLWHLPIPGMEAVDMVDNQHERISGYRDLSLEEIEFINKIKAIEAATGELWREVMIRQETDKRWGNIACTHFEEGFSALVRSVAQPLGAFRAN